MTRLRLAIACASLCASRGGSERAATALAAEMACRGHEVLLLSAAWPGGATVPVYGVPPGVRHMSIDAEGRHADIRRLREHLTARGTDVFLSMQSSDDHLLWAMACMGSGIPFICSERCDPVAFIESVAWNRPGRLAVLSGADCIHELLPAYLESVPEYFRDKVRVIPNAVPETALAADPVGEGRKRLLFLARLCSQKQPLLLLDAFRLLLDRHPDWDLILWGHGPQARKVEKYIATHGMEARALFRGTCMDSAKAFAEAQLYCLPSSYEGFPNTVLEAMSAGLPVVGLTSCTGVRDVVRDGVTGLLAQADTAASLAQALDSLMADAPARKAMGAAGKIACGAYAPENVYGQWETLFQEMAHRKGSTVMDAFSEEPFASAATLSAAARREWIFRDFGQAMPYSAAWWHERAGRLLRALARRAATAFTSRRGG